MNEIEKFAANISEDVKDESNPNFGSIIIVLMVASIIINVIRLMMACNIFGRNLESRIKNPSPIDKILLRRAIKKELPKEYEHLRPQIQEEILKKSKNLSSQQINAMMQEVKNAK